MHRARQETGGGSPEFEMLLDEMFARDQFVPELTDTLQLNEVQGGEEAQDLRRNFVWEG